MTKALIIFSGGLDSTVCLAIAKAAERDCIAVGFDYGQKHRIELDHALKITDYYGIPFTIIPLSPEIFFSSALVAGDTVAKGRTPSQIAAGGIPSTYVPARNTLFIAYATALAEVHDVQEIYYGANKADITGYPDCRPAYFAAVQHLLNNATKQAVEGRAPQLVTPLANWDKEQIIAEGKRLDAPLEMTFSCYSPVDGIAPCNECDACTLRNNALQASHSQAP